MNTQLRNYLAKTLLFFLFWGFPPW